MYKRQSGNHRAVLEDLLAGKCEAGGTYSLNYTGADEQGLAIGQLKLIQNTGTLAHDHLIARPDTDEAERAALVDALVAFDPMLHAGGVPSIGVSERITGFSAGWGPGGP